MRAKWVALGLVVVLGVYLVLLGGRGVVLIASGSPVGVLFGLGVLLLPLLTGWGIWREVSFGRATERMAAVLEREGGLPPDDLPRRPSGRVVREAADEAFARYRAEVDAAPEDWRSWFRLACAYDAAGDRRRARSAMRHAAGLHSAS